MLDNIFKGIFDSSTQTVIPLSKFLLCVGAALFIGILLALVYIYKSKYTKSFVVTLAILPSIVCVIIMMVNGNIGAGVAVAGAFSLVRFRSVPGSAKEIGAIFLAMGAGMIAGMGYLAYALLLTVILGFVTLLYYKIGFCENKANKSKTLRITIPENLDYTNVFDDLFKSYISSFEIIEVKTTNMGSMLRITYDIALKDASKEKEFIDEIRCRNGNLEVNLSRQEMNSYGL